jgi:hypothetical protein
MFVQFALSRLDEKTSQRSKGPASSKFAKTSLLEQTLVGFNTAQTFLHRIGESRSA